MKSTTSDGSLKRSPGRPKKTSPINPTEEKGNPLFNLNDAIPLTEAEALTKEAPLVNATNIVTAEDLAFERQLQAMHQEEPLVESAKPLKLEQEVVDSNFLGDHVDDYMPASSLNELEQQVWAAQKIGADSIEATEDVIKYYNRTKYPSDVGYFIYKNIRVFIPGRIEGHVETDKQNIGAKLRGLAT